MRENKIYLIISFIISILFFGNVLSFGQEDYTRQEKKLFQNFLAANKIFKKGQSYFLEGKLKKSEKELQKCLKKMPEHADASFFLSQIYYRRGDYEKSLEQILKAKENYKFLAKMKINFEQLRILKLQERKKDLEERLSTLKEYLAKALTVEQRSKIQSAMANAENEMSTIDNRLNRPLPSPEQIPAGYYYFHGNIFFRLKRFQEAHDQYQEAIKINPKNGDAYNNLANLYYMVRQYQKALEYLNLAEENGAQVNPEFKKAILKALKK